MLFMVDSGFVLGLVVIVFTDCVSEFIWWCVVCVGCCVMYSVRYKGVQ